MLPECYTKLTLQMATLSRTGSSPNAVKVNLSKRFLQQQITLKSPNRSKKTYSSNNPKIKYFQNETFKALKQLAKTPENTTQQQTASIYLNTPLATLSQTAPRNLNRPARGQYSSATLRPASRGSPRGAYQNTAIAGPTHKDNGPVGLQ